MDGSIEAVAASSDEDAVELAPLEVGAVSGLDVDDTNGGAFSTYSPFA
jgi:hypothetical protein